MGECVIVMPATIVVWDIYKGSDITDGTFVKMRGANTRTARYRVFLFIVKSEIKIFVWSVAKTTIYISSVGATIGRPFAIQSTTNGRPYIRIIDF